MPSFNIASEPVNVGPSMAVDGDDNVYIATRFFKNNIYEIVVYKAIGGTAVIEEISAHQQNIILTDDIVQEN